MGRGAARPQIFGKPSALVEESGAEKLELTDMTGEGPSDMTRPCEDVAIAVAVHDLIFAARPGSSSE